MATPSEPERRPHSIEAFVRAYEGGEGLLGFESSCGFKTATWVLVCPKCGARDLQETKLADRGTIAAFSIQHVPSEEFLNEAPYAYVVVDLDGGGRVTGWIAKVARDDELKVGDRVRYVPTYKPGVQFVREAP